MKTIGLVFFTLFEIVMIGLVVALSVLMFMGMVDGLVVVYALTCAFIGVPMLADIKDEIKSEV